MTKPKINWKKYKIRTCRTLHECAICGTGIYVGDPYFDGGYGKRAHKLCVTYNESDERGMK